MPVVTYSYNAWGNILSNDGDLANTLGEANALRYRGYVYDNETALYYLRSRYYNPELGRFINADALVATGQGVLGNNMFAYCHNNPIVYVDPSGYIIVLSPDTTEEQEREYDRAIAYINTSEKGKKLIECLETSSEVFTIVFVDDDNMHYDSSTNIIYFDINSGLIVGDGLSVQSAALGLVHEMGHAAQDLDGTINKLQGDNNLIESLNLEQYETPIAKELGEPTRLFYSLDFGTMDMKNSTHYVTTASRPWWHYLLFWNWGKPRKITIDHNVS